MHEVEPKGDSHFIVNTSDADLKPYVLETPIGNQMMQRIKSSIIKKMERRKMRE